MGATLPLEEIRDLSSGRHLSSATRHFPGMYRTWLAYRTKSFGPAHQKSDIMRFMGRALFSIQTAAFTRESISDLQKHLRSVAPPEQTAEQHSAWDETIVVLHHVLTRLEMDGHLFFEFAVPRLGSRIDVVLVMKHVVFVLEFKTGTGNTSAAAVDQVMDYALDLRYFHQTSHHAVIAPVLVTASERKAPEVKTDPLDERLLQVAITSPSHVHDYVQDVVSNTAGEILDPSAWESGAYEPTPTIIEAARALYRGHSVTEITRSSAGGSDLASTAASLLDVITATRESGEKAICFVTGVPGAGKTLIGLNLATTKVDVEERQDCVYLSGNGPLVAVLREALVRDAVEQAKRLGKRKRKGEASHGVKAFIQNVHHFRDDCIKTTDAPHERIVVFDEAQRAWDLQQTRTFMKQKKGIPDFDQSEPEFLISCLDRHSGWAVIVCLVGNGQEINRGEAGITAWLEACATRFSAWKVYASPHLSENEERAHEPLKALSQLGMFTASPNLHLTASVRSFRSDTVSAFVNALLHFEPSAAQLYRSFQENFPIVLTRDVTAAKDWVRHHARGSERYGILASSAAQRLRPYAIDVTSKINPVHWFLNGKSDVRSSYFLESVATEFDVQGLELDWTCIAWDADFRHRLDDHHWQQYSFRGDRWENVKNPTRQAYQVNAYRVLLTRARQGMVICVPPGSTKDHTRQPAFYDGTYSYLRSVGIQEL